MTTAFAITPIAGLGGVTMGPKEKMGIFEVQMSDSLPSGSKESLADLATYFTYITDIQVCTYDAASAIYKFCPTFDYASPAATTAPELYVYGKGGAINALVDATTDLSACKVRLVATGY
jgi:hypothetical protein